MPDILTEMQKRWGVHHIWCNFYGEERADTCSMCGPTAKAGGLNKRYPQSDLTADELMKKHFPNNRKVEDQDG